MERRRVFPWEVRRAAIGRRPLLAVMTGLLALSAWASAAAQPADNQSRVPEPVAAPQGVPAQESLHWVDPQLPKTPRRSTMAVARDDDGLSPDPVQPPTPKRSTSAKSHEAAPPLLDPAASPNPRRSATAGSHEDDAPLLDPEPSKAARHARATRPRAADGDLPPEQSYVEDDDTCDGGAGCPDRLWDAETCWRPLANRLEARGEWLLWWGKGDFVPALVTTGATTQTQSQAGVLGAPTTSILLGNSTLNDEARSGWRITGDYWLTCDHSWGLEAQYFALGDSTASFHADSNAYPVLARPFYNAQTGAADSGLIGYPGVQTGSVNVAVTSSFQGAEALLRHTCYCNCNAHLDFLAGYRYLQLSDNLRIDEFETFIDPVGIVPVNSTLALSDRFSTLNEFQGGEVGFASDWHCHRWDLGFLLKVGMGDTNSHVSINGSTTAAQPTQAPVTSAGGFLAQGSNSGQFLRNQFTMVPELGLNLGFDLTPRLRLMCGYSLIYWSAVARAGDQIDLNLTPPQFPPQTATGLRVPEFRFAMTDYWAQGLNLGLDFRF